VPGVQWSAGGYKYLTSPSPPSITFFLLINHFHCCYFFIYFFISYIRCIYGIYSLRNRGFRGTPQILRVGVYLYHRYGVHRFGYSVGKPTRGLPMWNLNTESPHHPSITSQAHTSINEQERAQSKSTQPDRADTALQVGSR
jgi:hypothetical protein